MMEHRQRRQKIGQGQIKHLQIGRRQIEHGWILIAAIAIGFALLILLVPHGHSGNGADFAAILPLLFVGVISPLSLLAPMVNAYAGHVAETPVLVPSFQRPPPLRRG
jgi:hypothetical protein